MAYVPEKIEYGTPNLLGANRNSTGTNFALFSANATAVELCLFSKKGKREIARFFLPGRTGDIWHGFVPGLPDGALYGYRVYGPYEPEKGHRFNPNKLLLDPYAKILFGEFEGSDELLGYDPASNDMDLSFSEVDSAPYMPKCVVGMPDFRAVSEHFAAPADDQTVIYETHVKGVSMLHPEIPKKKRGTFEGLSTPVMLDHFNQLGVTSIELLPVQAFFPEPRLTQMGLTNYWGYNPISYFVAEPSYMGPAGISSFQKMVKKLHGAGIEVILDVVYNHTAESWEKGPTLSFRGIDNASYYRLQPDNKRFYINDTGCGNSLNLNHPAVLRLVMDSLRYWVTQMHVDGFRFDLATTLARTAQGFDAAGTFLSALMQDPTLSKVKLIAEPWDIGPGGYQLGTFPAGIKEWNDQYRDSMRRYWLGDATAKPDMAAALLGSSSIFDDANRSPLDSVNFVTSHDGFTLHDLVSYKDKHNHKNGEQNRDGHSHNLSDNCGIEGETNDPSVLLRRQKRQRNLLASIFLSQGTPMLLSGDELGNSQQGNNNAYCQDNEMTWLDWENYDEQLAAFTAGLTKLRKNNSLLRHPCFLHGETIPGTENKNIEWLTADGQELVGDTWHNNDVGFAMLLRNLDDALLVFFNAGLSDANVTLPAGRWSKVLDTARVGAEFSSEFQDGANIIAVAAESLQVWAGNQV